MTAYRKRVIVYFSAIISTRTLQVIITCNRKQFPVFIINGILYYSIVIVFQFSFKNVSVHDNSLKFNVCFSKLPKLTFKLLYQISLIIIYFDSSIHRRQRIITIPRALRSVRDQVSIKRGQLLICLPFSCFLSPVSRVVFTCLTFNVY